MTQALLTVVLAGGEGRRMGGDKPLQRYGETTLLGRAIELASAYSPSVAVAVRHPAQVGVHSPCQILTDDPAVPGPMAGLASGLVHARAIGAELMLSMPCDTPKLPGDLASRLEAHLTPDAMVAVAFSAGRLHPTCALWRTRALDHLAAYLATGRTSLRGFADKVGMVEVDWPTGEHDPFANANTCEDLAALQPRFRSRGDEIGARTPAPAHLRATIV